MTSPWLRHPARTLGALPRCPHGRPFASRSLALGDVARLRTSSPLHAVRCTTPGCGWHLTDQPVPMAPEPCGSGEPAAATVPPLQPWDLRGQLTDVERAHINDIPLEGKYL